MKRKSARAAGRRRNPGPTAVPTPQPPVSPARGPWLTIGTLLASAALQSALPSSLLAAVPGSPASRLLPEFGVVGVQITSPAEKPVTYEFAISPGPLEDVLADVARITGARFSFTLDELRTIQSPGVIGVFSLEQAVAAALDAAGMVARFTDTRHVTIDLEGQSASVAVVGRSVRVASPKYVVPVREIPQTVAVIPRDVMEAQAASTLSEALRNVPGITMQAGEGGGASNTAGDMFNLRGFNAANSLFVDGVRDDGLISRDTFNLEQVEVFMGPAGTDVGRGTAAGYVNMQTKTPRGTAAQSALLSAGTANQKRATADLNVPVPLGQPDTWLGRSALRLNVLWQDSGTPGRDLVAHSSRSVAPSIALGLQTSTRIVASAQVVRQDNLPDYGVPGAAWTASPLTPTTQVAPRPVDQTNFYGSATADYDDASQHTALARIEHDLSTSVSIRNQVRYNETTREAVISAIQNVAAFTPTTNLVTLTRQGNRRENRILSNLSSVVARFMTGGLRHAVTGGVEVSTEEQRAPGLTGLGTLGPVDIFAPDAHAPVAGFAPTRSGTYSNGAVDTLAAYGSDAIDLGMRWQVSGALRAEHYDASFSSLTAAGVQTDEESSAVLLSGKVGTLFRVTSTSNLYASLGTTKTPPGTANFTLSSQANNQNNPNVRPQQSLNVEAGGKWDLHNGRLSMAAAVFRTVNRNVLYTVDAAAIPPVFNQDDEQLVRGAQASATGHITDAWEVVVTAAYLDSASHSQNALNNGRRLPLTPVVSGSLWTMYRLPRGLTLGGGLRHTGPVYVDAANTIRVPGYRLVDFVAEYPVNRMLSLRLNVSNVTDAVYIRNVNNNGGRYNPGYSRAALVTTSLRF